MGLGLKQKTRIEDVTWSHFIGKIGTLCINLRPFFVILLGANVAKSEQSSKQMQVNVENVVALGPSEIVEKQI
jgi:hypothetical protein